MTETQRPKRDSNNFRIVTLTIVYYFISYHFGICSETQTIILCAIIFVSLYRRAKITYLNGSMAYFLGCQSKIDWNNQVVFLTGGSNGLGKSLVKELLVMRPKLIINVDIADNDITHERLQTINCDIADSTQLQSVCKTVIKEHGTPTVVILNAGAFDAKSLVDSTTRDFRNTLDVNFTSHLEILNAFLPGFIERNSGHIVSIASILGELHAAQAATYCASKAAVISLFQCLRVDLKHLHNARNVKTSLVLPGLIQTQLFGNVKHSKSSRLPSWLTDLALPSINPNDLARRIIVDLNTRRTGDIRSPYFVHGASWYYHLPQFVLDILEYWIGVHDYIDHVKAAIKKE